MFSFKNSLLSLVGLLVIVGVATLMPLVGRGKHHSAHASFT